MSHLPRITKDDSADLGFAWACLLAGAVTHEEFKAWAEHVAVATPTDTLPPFMIDLMMAEDRNALTVGLNQITGFWPSDPALDGNGPADAVFGIAALRGRHRPDDAGTEAGGSIQRLNRHPEVLDRFARVFPFLPVPKVA